MTTLVEFGGLYLVFWDKTEPMKEERVACKCVGPHFITLIPKGKQKKKCANTSTLENLKTFFLFFVLLREATEFSFGGPLQDK